MTEQLLEFRGIRLEHLMDYLKDLKAVQQTFKFPFVFEGPDWHAKIISEDEVRFTPIFVVNAVFIRFEASTEAVLQDVITAYRRKTFRAGG